MKTAHQFLRFSLYALTALLAIILIAPVASSESVWQSLKQVPAENREKIELVITIGAEAGATPQLAKRQVENLWKSGDYVEAVSQLRLLEARDDIGGITVSQLYHVPVLSSIESVNGTDVQVSSLDSAHTVDFDVDYESGKIFLAYTYMDGGIANRSHFLYSDDNGQNWFTIMTSASSDHIFDIDVAIVEGECILAWVEDVVNVDVRRYDIDTDEWVEFQLGGYTQRALTSTDGAVYQLELATTDDLTADVTDVCWMAATTSGGRFYWLATQTGIYSWSAWVMQSMSAYLGLGLTLNQVGGTYGNPYWMYASFLTSTGRLKIIGLGPGVPITLYDYYIGMSGKYITGIAASNNKVYCLFNKVVDAETEAFLTWSMNSGSAWSSLNLSGDYLPDFAHDITARHGEGVGLFYSDPWINLPYAGTRGAFVWMDNDLSPWNDPVTFTNYWPDSRRQSAIEYLGNGYYGIAWITGWESSRHGLVYFDTMPRCCNDIRGNANGDGTEDINISDITYLVDYLFGIPLGPAPNCPEEGNANGDGAGDINISDITYLVEYLFGIPLGPPPPACP